MRKERPRRAGRPRNPVSRVELLSAARVAFAETGYAGTSMNDIAQRAGIRKPSLFHHFRTKEALYLEMLSDITAGLAQLVAGADLGEGSFLERLDRLGTLVIRYLSAHPGAAALALHELADGGPFSRGPGRGQVELAMKGVAFFLQSGMDEGAIAPADPRQLAVSIIALHLFYFAASDTLKGLFDRDALSIESVEERTRAVLTQVRRLCGATDGRK